MKWNLDTTHSIAEFAVKHLMISTVKGRFKTVTGTAETNADGTLKSAAVTIDVASIDTNVEQRDTHLRSADFFDVANFPSMTFTSTKIVQKGEEIAITGDFTIRGVTKPLTMTGEITGIMKDPWGLSRAAINVSAKIKRSDWGMTWNAALETGGFVVGDEVKILLEAEAVAEAAAAPAEVAAAV
jgi:polyisoprenoid-binding protein YceI